MLEAFLAPRSVAVVGAAREEGKVGHFVFDNLLAAGFSGRVYPVNPKADEIHGHRCYASLSDIPGGVDLAVVVVPPKAVTPVMADCARAGCHAAIIITAGFKETGREGAALERELLDAAHAAGVRILGPNCLGLIATPSCLDASFAGIMPAPGAIAFMSQSGALGTAILDWATGEGIGMSYFASLGNKADLDETDFVTAWRDDEHAGVVVAYLESVSRGEAFVREASELVSGKPFVVVKSGGSEAGARAVSSHTGSLAGSEAAYDAAFRRAGVIRARTVQELFDYATAFALQPLPQGEGVAILTNAGGPAIMATDACERLGVGIAALDSETIGSLHDVLPPAAALYNPVDVLGDADASRYREAARLLARDPNVKAILVILTPQATTEFAETAQAIAEVAAETGVTTLACFMGEVRVAPAREVLRASRIPNYPFPERAVAALGGMQRYRAHLARPATEPPALPVDRATAAARLEESRARGLSFVTEEAAAGIANAYGIPTPAGELAGNLAAAKQIADRIGYPVVMKIASPDILHKSDIGGIRLGIADAGQLVDAYEDIMASVRRRMPDAQVWGVEVQQMVTDGTECIVGIVRDPTFGPLVAFGLGGVYVEVLRDVTFRLCPLTIDDAREMIADTRAMALLRGARGKKPADVDAIVDVLVRTSKLAVDFPDILELDINPLIVRERGQGAVAADIRIGIGG